MNLQTPAALIFLLFIPLYWIMRHFEILKKTSITAVLSDWQGNVFEWKDSLTRFFYILSKVFIYAGFVLAVTALSDPVHKSQEKIYTSRGTDIMFVLDTSPSMVAKDVNDKTRLQASKEAVENLFSANKGTRCGIVTMGSEAAVLVPPTNDFDTFRSRLKDIQAGSMGDGSAIGTGISTAAYHLISSAAPKRCIVLFTDGENNAGEIHPETAAEVAARNNITLYVFGVGTKGTVSIDYTDPISGKKYSGYLNSDFNASSLRNLALIGNGKYFEASTQDQLAQSLDAISQNETLAQDYTYKTVLTSYYKKILTAVLFCFLGGWIVTRIFMRYRKFILLRSIGLSLSLICTLLSLSDLSWGTTMVPVQKSSSAVSFVYDISNSMTAKDETNGMSRLEAVSTFSKNLLSRMDGTPVSVILCKGDGITAVPLTEDYVMVESLLSSLSPALMSAPGTSIDKGISAAKDSFPEQINSARHIWVFTDGGDSNAHLSSTLNECIKKGIDVKIIGFGSEQGYDIKAGDNKTIVHTSLERDFILESIEKSISKIPSGVPYPKPEFVEAHKKGTGASLIHTLDKNKLTDSYITYEEKSVSRYKFFLTLALIFFMLAVFISENNIKYKMKKIARITAVSLIFLTGCSKVNIKGKISNKTFKGSSFYRQQEFEKAAGEFLETFEIARNTENQNLQDYALYNISTAYLMSNEKEAALEKLSKISDQAPSEVRFNTYFNAGVIYYRLGENEKAAECFRNALEINNTSIDAKINLELSMNRTSVMANETQAEMKPSGESSGIDFDNLEKTVFERIKENDKKQWKNSETTKTSDLSSDY